MSKSILNASLSAALPDSLREDPTIAAVCVGIDPQLAAGAGDAGRVMPWAGRLEVLPVAELDHIAWSFADHVWDQSWSDDQKRAYVGGILRRKKDLGTPARIAEAFSTLGYTAEVRDSMTHPAEYDPGRFAVVLTNQPTPMDQQWRLLHIVEQIKPASRWYVWIHERRVEALELVGAAAHAQQITHLGFFTDVQPSFSADAEHLRTASAAGAGVMFRLEAAAQDPDPASAGASTTGILSIDGHEDGAGMARTGLLSI